MRLLSIALVLALVAETISAQDVGWSLGRVSIEGPLERAVFRLGDRGLTVLECDLVAGEARELDLPFNVYEHRELFEPELVTAHSLPDAVGRAVFLGWQAAPWADRFEEIPIQLRVRSRPVLVLKRSHAPTTALAALAGALALLFATRSRPRIAAVLGLGFAGLLYSASALPGPTTGRARVIEGDLSASSWVVVDAGRGTLALPEGDLLAVEIAPRRSGLVWTVRSEGDRLVQRLGAPGAHVFATSAFAPGERRVAREANRWGDFESTWLRDGVGAFRPHGEWRLGAPFPAALSTSAGPEREPPPGWLVSGLPQGVPCLVGRLAEGEAGTPESDDPLHAGTTPTWIRVTGF